MLETTLFKNLVVALPIYRATDIENIGMIINDYNFKSLSQNKIISMPDIWKEIATINKIETFDDEINNLKAVKIVGNYYPTNYEFYSAIFDMMSINKINIFGSVVKTDDPKERLKYTIMHMAISYIKYWVHCYTGNVIEIDADDFYEKFAIEDFDVTIGMLKYLKLSVAPYELILNLSINLYRYLNDMPHDITMVNVHYKHNINKKDVSDIDSKPLKVVARPVKDGRFSLRVIVGKFTHNIPCKSFKEFTVKDIDTDVYKLELINKNICFSKNGGEIEYLEKVNHDGVLVKDMDYATQEELDLLMYTIALFNKQTSKYRK